MKRRDFLGAVVALFAAPAAILGVVRRRRVPASSESIYQLIKERMESYEAAMRDVLDEDFKRSLTMTSSDAMAAHNRALAALLDEPHRYGFTITNIKA